MVIISSVPRFSNFNPRRIYAFIKFCTKKKRRFLDVSLISSARDRNRTGTVLLQQDFKSCASASSATRAHNIYLYTLLMGPTGLEPVTLCL